MINTRNIIITLVALLLLYLAYKWYKSSQPGTGIIDSTGKLTKADAGAQPQAPVTESFPLQQGMQGPNVMRLQTALNWIRPTSPLLVDGVLGSQTYGKLVTTVPTSISSLPMSEANFNTIIALGNKAKLG